MNIDWASLYTDTNRLDVLSKALTIALNDYFNENYICQEVEVIITRVSDRDIVTIERID